MIGGAAGAVPPLVGYTAAAGHLGWAALAMFGIVFLWTPPHFWALALMIREHYENASVPMLPNVKGERETARQIVWYTLALVAATLVPVAFGVFGLFYGVSALALGLVFIWMSVSLRRQTTKPRRREALPLLDALPGAAVRGHGARRGRLNERTRSIRPGRPGAGVPSAGPDARRGRSEPRAHAQERRPHDRSRDPLPAALRGHLRRRAPLPAPDIAGLDGIFITELEPGPGIRLAVKDLFDTAGIRTTYGSAVFADHVPSETAPAVAQLEAAGYADVGKANLHEFAYGTTSQNVHYGTVPNPRFPGRTAGGSSGGSAAALAAGLADAALGTDSGGSIRIPSACCGTTGFKPSYGLVSTEGVFPLAPSFDHAGPMANDVAGCVAMMAALVAGLRGRRGRAGGLAGRGRLDRSMPIRSCVPGSRRPPARFRGASRVDLPFAADVQPLFMREIADVHRDLYAENDELYGENIRPKIERCLTVTTPKRPRRRGARAAYRATMETLFAPFDLLADADDAVRRAAGRRRRDRRPRPR